MSERRNMKLSQNHRLMLIEGSGIAPEVLEARGYRTVEIKAELERFGFSRAQRSVPALLIPQHGPGGEINGHQIRPDDPRTDKNGRLVKYESPVGTRPVLDVPPSVREKLRDIALPMFLTEGSRKADSLASRGLCGVSVPGVWGWRGTNVHGGKLPLPDWELVALNSRRVYLVFDSDIMLKVPVYRAMLRLKAFLEGRGAEVLVIYLPAGEGGVKRGIDDFLVAGHGVDDLLALAAAELREPPEDNDLADEPDTQAAKLVRYAEEADLFHTPDREAYASVPVEED